MHKTEKKSAPRHRVNYVKKYGIHYVGIAPFFALFFAFIAVPLVQGIAMSFTDWSTRLRGGTHFTGLENYIYLFTSGGTSSTRFLKSLKNLAIYVPTTILIGMSMALLLALLVSQYRGRFYSFLRGTFYIPTVLPLYLCAGIWQWYLNGEGGLVASMLSSVGIGRNINWIYTSGYAIAVCVIVDVWHATGFNFVILSAVIQNISPEYYEASEIDGASIWNKIWHIDIPGILPTILIILILDSGSILSVGYEKVYLMQNAQNSTTSEVISTYVYKQGLIQAQYSYSSAVGLFNSAVNFVFLIIVNLISAKLSDTSLF